MAKQKSTAKGLFRPKNPEKYLGDVSKIRFMSSWEARFMVFCDTNPNVLNWASEEIRIKYYHPVKKKVCDYVPDFLVKYRNTKGEIVTKMFEIKPNKENPDSLKAGVIGKKQKKVNPYNTVMMVINHAKWTAARAFCHKAGIEFVILTENDMFKQ